jgi:hypothetical protein
MIMEVIFTHAHFLCFSFQSEIGFGKIESYTKLDKLGEVSLCRSLAYSLIVGARSQLDVKYLPLRRGS